MVDIGDLVAIQPLSETKDEWQVRDGETPVGHIARIPPANYIASVAVPNIQTRYQCTDFDTAIEWIAEQYYLAPRPRFLGSTTLTGKIDPDHSPPLDSQETNCGECEQPNPGYPDHECDRVRELPDGPPSNPVAEYFFPQEPTGMGIGEAMLHLKNGGGVTRRGWNGTGMYLTIQVPDSLSFMTEPYIYISRPGVGESRRVPWNASQEDILALDWEIV